MRSLLMPIALLAALAAAPALAQKPVVDWDTAFDFDSCATFAWGDGGTPADDINEKRIISAVVSELHGVGLIESKEAADLWVVTHARADRVTRSSGTRVGFGFGSFGRSGGASVGTSVPVGDPKTATIGTLVVELYSAETGEMVWTAQMSDTLGSNAEKMEKAINKAVARAFKKYPVKKKK